MKKAISILFSISTVCFMGCSEHSVSNTEDLSNQDNAYNVASNHLNGAGYVVDENESQKNDNAILIPIFDSKGDNSGALLKKDGVWSFSLVSENTLKVFKVSKNQNGKFEVIEDSKYLFAKENLSEEEILESKILSGKIRGPGYCRYVSYVGFNFGCWDLETNPWAQYHKLTIKTGDPITDFHYQWCADWTGNAVVCPLNETTNFEYHCGHPNNCFND